MAANQSTVRVQGLTGLRRAFRAAGKHESRELTREIRASVEPVRTEAESLTRGQIREGRLDWAAMRIGTTAHSAYVAPSRRRSGGSPRPNLAGIVLSEMVEALDRNAAEVEIRIDRMLGEVGRVWETTS